MPSAETDAIMAELERLGTEQNRKVYARHGAHEPFYGVSFANLNALAKRYRRRNDLAEELWATGNLDARTLVSLVADPKTIDPATFEVWVREIDYYPVADYFARHLVLGSPAVDGLMRAWTTDGEEYVRRVGFALVALRALRDETLGDDALRSYLTHIESELQRSPNRARESMNGALIAIGLRNAALREEALRVARAIGPVEIDHGDTGCRTPDAVAELTKPPRPRRRRR